jgi:hypothetical protein
MTIIPRCPLPSTIANLAGVGRHPGYPPMMAGNYTISAKASMGFAAFPFSFPIHVINTALSPVDSIAKV